MRTFVILGWVSLLGCSSPLPGAADSGTDGPAVMAACPLGEGAMFRSVNQLPSGDKPGGGIVSGYWLLSFTKGSVCWRHDDVLCDQGTYTCDGLAVHGSFAGIPPLQVEGSYDPSSGVLRWAGENYVKQ
jgi:hypothetical protein